MTFRSNDWVEIRINDSNPVHDDDYSEFVEETVMMLLKTAKEFAEKHEAQFFFASKCISFAKDGEF